MTADQIKEAISREFLRILANGHGFKAIEPPDHGVDMIIYPVTRRTEPSGKTRYLDSPYKLDFQLKATTTSGIIDAGEYIKFDLEVKNYNDLIYRRDEPLPLHLVIVVLTESPPDCIHVDGDMIGVKGCAYWYLPDEGLAETENTNQIRITIPKANRLNDNFVRARFEDLGIEL